MPCLFAVEDGVVAIIGAVAAALGAGGAWLVKVISDSRKTSLDEYREIVGRLQKQVDRCQSQVDEQQRAISEMVTLHAECRAETQELYGFIVMLHLAATQLRDRLVSEGKNIEVIPDLPPRPMRARDDRVEYLRRQTQHNTNIAKQAQREDDRAGAPDRGRPGQPGPPGGRPAS